MAGEIVFTYKRKRRLSNSVVIPENGCPNSSFGCSIDKCLLKEDEHVEACKNISQNHKLESGLVYSLNSGTTCGGMKREMPCEMLPTKSNVLQSMGKNIENGLGLSCLKNSNYEHKTSNIEIISTPVKDDGVYFQGELSRQTNETTPFITFTRRSKKGNSVGGTDLQNEWLAAQDKYSLHKVMSHNIKEDVDFSSTQSETALKDTDQFCERKEPNKERTNSQDLSTHCLSLSASLLLPGDQASIGEESQLMIFSSTKTSTMPCKSPRACLDLSVPLPDSCATMECDIVSDSRSLKQPNLNSSTHGDSISSGCVNQTSILPERFPQFSFLESSRPVNGTGGNNWSSRLHQPLISTHTSTNGWNKSYKDSANACSISTDIDFRNKCLQLFSDVKENDAGKSNLAVCKDGEEATNLHLGREGNNGFIPPSEPNDRIKKKNPNSRIKTNDFLSSFNGSFESSWSEEELDFLWIGVRRHGKERWDAILRDPKFHFSSWRVAADLAQRWELEQIKFLKHSKTPETESDETQLSLGDVYSQKKDSSVFNKCNGTPCNLRWEEYTPFPMINHNNKVRDESSEETISDDHSHNR